MDQPQEEFIEPQSANVEDDRDHGHEIGQAKVIDPEKG